MTKKKKRLDLSFNFGALAKPAKKKGGKNKGKSKGRSWYGSSGGGS
jgi:hypothetical protein